MAKCCWNAPGVQAWRTPRLHHGQGTEPRGGGQAPALSRAQDAGGERMAHVNRIKGLLFAQGVCEYEPLRGDRRQQQKALRTGDGRFLPPHLKAQIGRELDRLELLLEQLKAVEAERNAVLEPTNDAAPIAAQALAGLRGIGPEFTAILWSECLFRSFSNRRQWPPMPGWRRHRGKVDWCGMNRACPSRATRGCDPP